MKWYNVFTILFLIMAANFGILTAQEDNSRLNIMGKFSTDQRFLTQKENKWSWNENRLNIQLESRKKGEARFFSEVWLRSFGFPGLTHISQLSCKDLTSPYNLDIREAYVDLYGFLTENLDIRIGRQRLAWGRGDVINPTNNLDPYDLEDIWDFGRYHGSDGIKITYYIRDWFIEGAFFPFFRPATLPVGELTSAFSQDISLPAGLLLKDFRDSLLLPDVNLGESGNYGIKLGGFLLGYDVSVSYVYGRSGLPVPDMNIITPVDLIGGVNLKSFLYYPRMNILGADLAGAIGSVGIWSEIGAFFPDEKLTMTVDLSSLGIFPPDSTILDKEIYLKYLIGADYTFRDGSYVNLQFLHGFFHEMGRDNLNDYFIFSFEKKLFDDKLKLNPVTGAFIVSDWKNLSSGYALIYSPSITYSPNDNAEIMLGVRVLEGKGDNMFVRLIDKDEVFVKFIYSF